MKDRQIDDPVMYTNLLFFINSILYGVLGLFELGLNMIISALISSFYHQTNESSKTLRAIDQIAVKVLLINIFIHLALLAKMDELIFSLLWLVFCLLINSIAHDSDTNYDLYHTVWHVMVFFGNILVCIFITN